ncbi:MAG: electron transfer flavoprotein subunit beta/FixA family protein [Actinomycetota bacterium]
MNIVVCIKRVPDTAAEKKLDPNDKTLDRESVETILNPMDEYAVEAGLKLKESIGGEVTVACMGPEPAITTIRKALSMGADKGLHLHDPALHGSCSQNTAYAMAQALKTIPHDIVLCGAESTDARTSLVPAALGEYLGYAALTYASKLEVNGSTIRIQRDTDAGHDVIEAQGPAVVSVIKGINEPRYPSFKGIMAAKSKPVTDLTLADIGVDASAVGAAGARTAVVEFAERPPRTQGMLVKDEGDGGTKLAEFLQAQKFI